MPAVSSLVDVSNGIACLFCVSDSDEACMCGMVQVTLVRGSEESLEDLTSESRCGDEVESVLCCPSFRSGETCMATRFLLGGRI